MSKSKGVDTGVVKAHWDFQSINIFNDICIKEIEAGNRPGTHFNKNGWENIIKKFHNEAGKLYTKAQLKNRWDLQKDKWKLWKQLMHKETGLGWDSKKNTVDASDEWWEAKMKVNPKYKDFKREGISPELEQKFELMFGNIIATGEHAWAPSSGMVPISLGDDEEEEEFDDSPIEGQSNVSQRKRSSDSTTMKGNAKVKRAKKMTASNKLSSQIDKMVDSLDTMSNVSASRNNTSIPQAHSILHGLTEIISRDPIYYFAVDALKNKDQRETFVSMLPEKRVRWLEMEYDKSLKN